MKCGRCGQRMYTEREGQSPSCLACDGPSIEASYEAVRYLLDRIQRDADLSWLMMGTESFAQLVKAEALATGKPYLKVRERREQDLRSPHDRPPARLPVAEERLRRIEDAVAEEWTTPDEKLAAIKEALELGEEALQP